MFSLLGLVGDNLITKMKIVLLMSVCSVVSLSDISPKDTADVSTVVLSLIPPGSSISLDIVIDDDTVPYRRAGYQAMTTTMENEVDDDFSKLRRSYLDCIDETRVNVKRVVKFKAGSWAKHPSLSKWALCVLVKQDLMSPQGVYRYDTAMSKINDTDKDKVDKILSRCLSRKTLPPQDIAWNYLKCIRYQDKKREFPLLSLFYTLK